MRFPVDVPDHTQEKISDSLPFFFKAARDMKCTQTSNKLSCLLFLYIAPPKGQKPEKPLYSQEVSLGDEWKIRGCNRCEGFVCINDSESILSVCLSPPPLCTSEQSKPQLEREREREEKKKHNKLLQNASFKQRLEFSGATEQLHFQPLTSESPEWKEIKILKYYIFTLFEGVK